MTGKMVGETLNGLIPRLEKMSDTPGLDVQVLMAYLLGKPRVWVMAHPETLLNEKQSTTLESLVARLAHGEPLPYVLGSWEFFGLEFYITPDVLIPRPETEILVERALAWLRHRLIAPPAGGLQNRQANQQKTVEADRELLRAFDIGTGCGCIAISLAVNLPEVHMLATDISPAAIAVARRNAARQHVAHRVEFFCCDLFPTKKDEGRRNAESTSSVDLIVANLPYIPTQPLQNLPVHLHEPGVALDGGADGLALIRRLLIEAAQRLAPGGLLLLEIESSQGTAVLSLAYDAFSRAEIHLHKDLSGHDRLLEVQV